jgi:ABC-2 type transport system permease protein
MSAALTLWHKHMRKSLLHTEEVVGMLIQPVLWVLLFGIGMGNMLGTMTPNGGDSYITFMLPGIIALTALGGAVTGGFVWLNERTRGIVKEYLVAPIPRLSILLGNALSTVTKSVLQALIILGVGILIGAQFSANLLDWLTGLLLITGYGLGFAGIALAFASKTDSSGAYHTLIFLFNLPLLFLSNALYPLDVLPRWMQIGSLLNPTTYVVSGLRQSALAMNSAQAAAEPFALWLCFLATLLFSVFGVGLAYLTFRGALE